MWSVFMVHSAVGLVCQVVVFAPPRVAQLAHLRAVNCVQDVARRECL